MTAFEALKEIKEGISYGFYDGKSLGYYKKHFELIEKELKALEKLFKSILKYVIIKPCDKWPSYDTFSFALYHKDMSIHNPRAFIVNLYVEDKETYEQIKRLLREKIYDRT